MRKLKFRAWEKELEEMIPVYNISFTDKMINKYGVWRFFDEVELMQYTGIKDKNGKEIYELDILRCCNPETDSTFDALVYFDEPLLSYSLRDKFGDTYYLTSYSSDGEVVGNMFESPFQSSKIGFEKRGINTKGLGGIIV